MSLDEIPPDIARIAPSLPSFPDGRIDYTHASEAVILNCYVLHRGKLLLVKRSDKVGWLKGRWHVVGGFIDEPVTVREKTVEELREELGLTHVDSIECLPLVVETGMGKRWILYRVVVRVPSDEVSLDWENTACAWVGQDDLDGYDLLPGVLATARTLLGRRRAGGSRRGDHT